MDCWVVPSEWWQTIKSNGVYLITMVIRLFNSTQIHKYNFAIYFSVSHNSQFGSISFFFASFVLRMPCKRSLGDFRTPKCLSNMLQGQVNNCFHSIFTQPKPTTKKYYYSWIHLWFFNNFFLSHRTRSPTALYRLQKYSQNRNRK